MNAKKPDADKNREFAMKLYESVCANIRISDDISFKLMSFVPLTSGAGAAILSLAKIWTPVNSLAVILLSLVAALITFGLYKWEMRNVQKCNWFVDRAADLESYLLFGEDTKIQQFRNWNIQYKPLLFSILEKKSKPENQPNPQKDIMPKIKESRIRRLKIYVGKTEAEKIIYRAAILAWAVPIIVAIVS